MTSSRAGILAGLLAGLLSAGCHREPSPVAAETLPVVRVRTALVEARVEPVSEQVVGTVRSRVRATVEAKMAGRVESMQAVPGQRVKAGEVMAVLDARELSARRDQAVAVREQADRDLERMSRLVRDGAATASELDAVQSRQRIAAAAESEVVVMLGHARVVAPFDGIVTRKLADAGDLAVPGRALFEVEDPATLRFEADVPEALFDRVPVGARLPVRISSLAEGMEAVVSEVTPAADPSTRTYAVRLDLPSIPGLRTGQFGRVAVPTGPASGVQVPSAALVQRGQLEYLYVVEQGTARLRIVRTGMRTASAAEIVAGASLGETVVVSGLEQLRDGQKVTEE